ncbi:type VII secretion integral membrane protein EccD [Streptomyces sp. B3I8]|uniref:type VII secretion integral membrane protein EccD n=1 Tax=Streptomyces sp. B3I8 TaxID=3042303 RepID=UPI00278693B1|nr:type VII secretion integral membrane protein EccD [Streptomyces sp. B3I8]MDQ0786694.1 type VII secretion integral membrane protein EccD [Streptomyces sp. B3I8]
MDDERCRVTVVGNRRRVDLAVPARAAIAEYAPRLIRMCGQEEENDALPAVWSLALAGERPFSPGMSLAESGVADGATLYLRDVSAGEDDEPVITDLDELVREANEGGVRWDTRHRALTLAFLGVGTMTVAFGTLVVLGRAAGNFYPLGGLGALITGVGAALLAGHATRRAWPLPQPVRLGVALSAVPLLTLGAVLFPFAHSASAAILCAGVGAVIGALAARLAVNHVLTLSTLTLAAVGLLVTGLLAGVGVTLVEAAAVVAVLAMEGLRIAPALSGHLVALSDTPRDDATSEETVPELVRRGRRVLAGLSVLLSSVAMAAFAELARSGNPYALTLTATVAGVLLLNAGQSRFTAAVLPPAVTGVAGVAALALSVPGNLGAPNWAGPLIGVLVGLAMFGTGVVRALPDGEPTTERPGWVVGLAGALALASVLLAVGVFGVFGDLMRMGESL